MASPSRPASAISGAPAGERQSPFCDGSHQAHRLTPVPFTAAATEGVWLCGCKSTGGEPFCDGTHASL